MHFVNLYDRQLPGENRNKLEHGLWQSSWYVIHLKVALQQSRSLTWQAVFRVYTKASTVSQEGFFHPYVDTQGPLRARTIGTSPADIATIRFAFHSDTPCGLIIPACHIGMLVSSLQPLHHCLWAFHICCETVLDVGTCQDCFKPLCFISIYGACKQAMRVWPDVRGCRLEAIPGF